MTQGGREPAEQLDSLIRRHREVAGLTQRQLADAAGLSLGALRDVEQRRTRRPHARSVRQLAAALGLGQLQRDALLASQTAPSRQTAPSQPVPLQTAASRVGAGLNAGPQDQRGDGNPGQAQDVVLRLCVLGPLAAWRAGTPVPLGTARQRAVLGLLATHPGTGVHRDAIVDALWRNDPPASAVAIVQSQVSQLRQLLDPGPPAGARGRMLICDGERYRLHAEVRSDAGEFAELAGQAEAAATAGDLAAACQRYERALGLWRGDPLADVDMLRAHPAVVGLAWRRAAAVIAYAEAAAASGEHSRVVGQLWALAAREPLNERAHALLMTTLAATGQQAAALDVFADIRRRLDAELGMPPGPELANSHLRVLRQADLVISGGGSPAPGGPADAGGPLVVPHQLPAAVPGFAGRAVELAALTGMLDQAAETGDALVISAIGGTAGIGKTALAVHWANQVASRFPDGQLYVNLRGFGPSGRPATSAEAVRLFLDALGVPPQRIPAGQDAQAALYRSLLTGQRMVLVLDNAHDAAQVRPLLPGSPGCLVLVTSRSQLTGLAAADGAQLLTLDVLSEAEACELLARRLGRGRVAGEPAAVAELAGLCARLPLALAIAAARAAGRPGLPLAALAAELRGTQARLDGLGTGDPATDVRTVFSWSCQQLTEPTARMFRLLGVHPGPDITVPAAASLAGVPPGHARQALAELIRAHLVTEHAPGRYACHDLLRVYAAELARAVASDDACPAALHRVLDHYLHTGFAASRLMNPFIDLITLDPPRPRPQVRPEELADRQQALEWFQAERLVILAAISVAADHEYSTRAWQLPWAVANFFNWHGYWHELTTTQESALAAARHLGDRAGQAEAHHFLGQAKIRFGGYAEASVHLAAALELGRQLGSGALQARAHLDLGRACDLQGRGRDAAAHAAHALRLYRAAGHRSGEANALNAVGWSRAQLGRYQDAVDYTARALAMHRELGNQFGETTTLDSLGYAHHHLGHHTEAITCYQQALDVIGDLGDRHGRTEIITHLGDAYHAAGNHQAARDAWQQALAILDEMHHPDARQVRSRLSG